MLRTVSLHARLVLLAITLAATAAPAPGMPRSAADDEPEVSLRSAKDLPPVPIGTRVGAFAFVDSRYLPRTFDELGEHAVFVVVFTAETCPISMRYQPLLADLEREYRERGVQFLSVNVGADDTIAGAAAQAAECEVDFPVVKDFSGEVVAALGVQRTPEVVVLDGARVLRYRGRIDDGVRFGGIRAGAVRAYLREALVDVLAGREVAVPETPVEGCVITLHRTEPNAALTWSRDVAPIVRDNCRTCHSPGGVAPFSLWTRTDVVKRAGMIEEVVEQQRMPPWFASPDAPDLENVQALTPAERDTLLAWLRAGAPAGELLPEEAPHAETARTWRIEPDLVLEAEDEIEIPASGFFPYQHTTISYEFPRDTWVTGVEVLPSNSRVLHHATLTARTEKENGKFKDDTVHVYVPGGNPLDLDDGIALEIRKGATLRLSLHYTPTGKPEKDRVSVGLRFPTGVVKKRLYVALLRDDDFEIPPNHPAFPLTGVRKVRTDVTLLSAFGHMHLRGKDMRLWAVLPDGTEDPLLVIGNYDFDWQREYQFERGAKRVPGGSRFKVVGRFDNSAFNPYNPEPGEPVRFGLNTEAEMMYCWVYYTEDRERLGIRVNPKTGERLTGKARRDRSDER
jgi:thiol-disulfide isomerase/thioredoxin